MNQNTNVNLIPKFPFSGNLYFSQYDVGRVATINLVEDGTAYTIPSGATVKIQATKPSGLGFSVECTYSGSVVTVVSTETMTNECGRFPCELRIESGDVLLGTTNFTFNVEKSPHPNNTVDGDSEDIINQITVALNNALSDINDAKEEAIEEISQSGGGITEAVKQALLNCFAHVAWIDDQGQTYYDALEEALYPPANLVSISAVYTQSGTVYDNQTLDSLRSDLVVTALWDNQTTTTVTDYTLSGTLTEGTSTITVLYGDKSTTFDVTVTHAVTQYSITNNLTQCVNSNSATAINELTAYSGTLTANSGYIMGTVSITMGGTDITSTAYDSSTGAISIASVTGNIVITAEAVEDVGWVSGVPYTFTITNGYRVDASTFELVEDSASSYVELPCKGVDYLERYWSQFGGNCRMDFYDANDAHLQANTVTQNGTHGCTVSRDATKVIISGVTGRMQNLTVTPYGYPELGENTVWEADTIYVPEESTLSGTTIETGYMFGALAETISISIGYATSNVRGQYFFYDQNKDQISSTATAEIIGGTGIWRTPVSVPEGTYYVKVLLYNQSSVYNFGNALDNIRIVYNRTV